MIALALVLPQLLVARGELRKVARFGEELRVVVARGEGSNLLERSAVRELSRWPSLVTLELRPPIRPIEARALRRLPRFVALVPEGGERDPSLKLLAPALLRAQALSPRACGSLSAEPVRRRAAAAARRRPSGAPAPLRESCAPAAQPCAGLRVLRGADGEDQALADAPLDACALDWIAARLTLRSDPPREPQRDPSRERSNERPEERRDVAPRPR